MFTVPNNCKCFRIANNVIACNKNVTISSVTPVSVIFLVIKSNLNFCQKKIEKNSSAIFFTENLQVVEFAPNDGFLLIAISVIT